ncbi:MAG TPA: acetate--CoA ligase family protein [archaeon]|nr:acetate--CoA ligase family protein [archaeon]HLD81347.1 acetate--CoA ligase family protein [archaeon]
MGKPRLLNLRQSMELLEKHKIGLPAQGLAKTSKDAAETAKKLGFPVVLKIVSNATHKTDIGGVATNIGNEIEVKDEFEKMLKNAKEGNAGAIEGVLVQKQLDGHELIIGGKKDPQFGKVILVGLGGVMTEVFEDVQVRLVPIEPADAEDMLVSLKFFKVLKGLRNKKPANIEAVKDILLKASRLMEREKVVELDLNPVIVNEKEAIAVDARALVE